MGDQMATAAVWGLLVIAGVFLVPIWLRHRTRHLVARRSDITIIRDAVVELTDDDSVPEVVVSFSRFMANYASSPRLARMFFKALATGVLNARAAEITAAPNDLSRALEELTAKQARAVSRLYEHTLLASVSCDPLLSAVGRRLLVWGFRARASRDEVATAKTKHDAPVMADIMRQQPNFWQRELAAA